MTATATPAPEQRIASGANWFYWIAALSLVNSVIVLTGREWGFVLGLGITQLIDALGRSIGSPIASLFAFAANLLIAAVVVLFGYYARRFRALYVGGMLAYAVDGAIYAVAQDWLAAGFHGFVLFTMLPGAAAFKERITATPVPPAAEAPREREPPAANAAPSPSPAESPVVPPISPTTLD
jgi:hypothetical protein